MSAILSAVQTSVSPSQQCHLPKMLQSRQVAKQSVLGPCAGRQGGRGRVLVRSVDGSSAATPLEMQGPSFVATKDIQEIQKILPHRFPFLLVDRVIAWEQGQYAIGYKCVSVNDNFFPGHFPERAIMPGVLQVEAMAQLGGIALLGPANDAQKNNFYFGGVDDLRWRSPVVPGDVLFMRVDVVSVRHGMCKVKAKAYVGEKLVCSGTLTLVLAK